MRKAVLALGVVVLAVVLWVVLRRGEEREQTSTATATSEQAAAPAVQAELVEAAAIEEEARAPAAAAEKASEAEQETRKVRKRPVVTNPIVGEPLRISGTIVVVDESGAEHPLEDGTFTLSAMVTTKDGRVAQGRSVDVRAGAWTTALYDLGADPVSELQAGDFELGNRPAVPEKKSPALLPSPPDGFLALRVRWPARSLLHVRDRASGRELAPVLAIDWTSNAWDLDGAHPGVAAEHALNLGPSPVELRPREEGLRKELVLRVRSPGYAWARITIDETNGGERFVPLDPAGELEVQVRGTLPDPAAELWLFDAQSRLVFERPLAGTDSVVIDALCGGSYRIQAGVGDPMDKPVVLAGRTVEVVAGRRVSAELAIEPRAEVEKVPVAGTLRVPTEWGAGPFKLTVDRLDTPGLGQPMELSLESGKMEVLSDPPGAYRWSFGRLQSGRYVVYVDPFGFYQLLEVPPEGIEDARIEVPPPRLLFVRCVEDQSGAEVEVENDLYWFGEVPNGVSSVHAGLGHWNETTRRWEFRVPAGKLWIGASSERYGEGRIGLDARSCATEVELRLEANTGVRLLLRDGATSIPWDDSWKVAIHALEGQDEQAGWCSSGFLEHFAPGRYRLTLPEIPGYEPVPDPVVVIEKGTVKEHVIELVRRP